ncbi:hypothetical protein [Variovorax gossypii]
MTITTQRLTLTAGDLAGTPFESVRTQPWLMVLLGPLMVGLHRCECSCGQVSLARQYLAGTAALIAQDSSGDAARVARQALGAADSLELATHVMESPCWVTGGPLAIRSPRTAVAAHVRESMNTAAESLSLPLAPHRRLVVDAAQVVGSVCPACGEPVVPPTVGRPVVLAVATDQHGADMRPVPMVACL